MSMSTGDTQPILERYRLLAPEANGPWALLEAVERDGHLVFRSGKASSRALGLLTLTFLGGAVGILGFNASRWFAAPWIWVVWVVLLVPVIWLLRHLRALMSSHRYFEIDTESREFLVYPAPQPEFAPARPPGSRIPIDDVDYFLVHEIRWRRGGDCSIYAVLRDGQPAELVHSLGTMTGTADQNIRLLGHLCERPAYSLRADVPQEAVVVGKYSWREGKTRWGDNRLDRAKLSHAAVTLYDPAAPNS